MSLVRVQDALSTTVTSATERMQGGGTSMVGLATKFHDLDESLGGLRDDALYVLGGRPGMGKTSLALSIVTNIVEEGGHALFTSLEMSADLLALRILAGMTGIAAKEIEYGRIDGEQLAFLHECVAKVQRWNMHILDTSMTSVVLLEEAAKYKNEFGLDIAAVDYISLLRDNVRENENARVSQIIGNMRELARQEQIPVLALSQLNRGVDSRESQVPQLRDIRDSGAVEQDAHAVLFAYRPQYYENMHGNYIDLPYEDDAQIIIAKNRQGETGSLTARFYPKQMRWEQLAPVIAPPPPAGSLAEKVRSRRGPS